MNKNSFLLYTDYLEHIQDLSLEQIGSLFIAIMKYQKEEELPELDAVTKMAFNFIRSQLDKDNEKYVETSERRREAGKLGGRPKANAFNENQEKAKKANGFSEKQTKAKKPDNDNEYDNDNENDNDNTYNVPLPQVESRPAYPYEDIIDYLNQKAGTHFRHSSADTKKHIKARFNDGFTLEDFKTVIDKKSKEWKGTDMEKFLRPATLFGTKFEGYLNQKEASGSNNKFNSFKQNDYDFSNLEEQLLSR